MKDAIIEKIKKEFFLIDSLQNKAEFQVYSDSILTYHLNLDGGFYEICVIDKDSDFFSKEKIVDLLDTKNLSYLSCRYFTKLDSGAHEQIGETLEYMDN